MKNLLQRLLRWIRAHSRPDKVMYIGGSDTLPQPLPRAEEAALIARLADSDPAARQTLIERNLRLVVYIARRFENTGINIEDLISIGTIGLIKAINTFRADKNIKLAGMQTLAQPYFTPSSQMVLISAQVAVWLSSVWSTRLRISCSSFFICPTP